MLEDQDIQRYSRQLILKGWSAQLQQKMADTSVCLPATLNTAAVYLAAAGIRNLNIYGSDTDIYSCVEIVRNLDVACRIKTQRTAPSNFDNFDFSIQSASPQVEIWQGQNKLCVISDAYSTFHNSQALNGTRAALEILNSIRLSASENQAVAPQTRL